MKERISIYNRGEGQRRIKEVPLFSNIMFVLEDAGIDCTSNRAMANEVGTITNFMRREIRNDNGRSSMYFIEAETGQKMSMPLSEIQTDENGDPKFAAARYEAPYAGDVCDFVVYGWQTRRGEVFTACHPAIAFYPDEEEKVAVTRTPEQLPRRRLVRG